MSDSPIYFIRTGIHTHLVLPAPQLCALVPQLTNYFADHKWVRIGWGDYQYYGNEQQTKLMGLRALFLPTSSVLALLGIDDLQKELTKDAVLYGICIDDPLLASVALFVSRYVRLDPSNQITKVRERSNGELFFKSRGVYTILNTCNNWTSFGLRTAGLRLNPLLNIFSGQVERSVRKNGYLPTAR
tara:strand:+ start:1445 stop:2002 length:558 start_codon:yes stop_codon:yes gene_type:complete